MFTFPRPVVWSLCIWAAVAGAAAADVVYLKDGSHIETERAWIENGSVHFLLPGTQTVVIRYSREIVDRIESGAASAGPSPASPVGSAPGLPPGPEERPRAATKRGGVPASTAALKVEPPAGKAPPPDAGPPRDPTPLPEAGGGPAAESVDVSGLEGIEFYNPRRKKRYWTGARSHHETYQEALETLVRQYGHTPAWVESHMGDSNDLARIHRSLAVGDPPPQATPPAVDHPNVRRHEGIAFYNPRRARRYWARRDSRHDTLRQAVKALGQQYGRTPEWVESHMGSSNDLGRIHYNLIEADSHPNP